MGWVGIRPCCTFVQCVHVACVHVYHCVFSLCIDTATAQIIVYTTKLNMLAHIFADIQKFHHRRMIGIFGNIESILGKFPYV